MDTCVCSRKINAGVSMGWALTPTIFLIHSVDLLLTTNKQSHSYSCDRYHIPVSLTELSELYVFIIRKLGFYSISKFYEFIKLNKSHIHKAFTHLIGTPIYSFGNVNDKLDKSVVPSLIILWEIAIHIKTIKDSAVKINIRNEKHNIFYNTF